MTVLSVSERKLDFDAKHDIKKSVIQRYGKYVAINGTTKVVISEGDTVVAEGVSYCSEADHFTKKEGFKRALKRAMEKAGLNKAERTKVWRYFRRK